MIYAGGLVSICVIAVLMVGYARVFNVRRYVYFGILLLVVLTAAISQILPAAHLFRISVSEDLHTLFWVSYIALPVAIYSLLIRWIRQRVKSRDDT